MKEREMIEASNTLTVDIALRDDPPNIVLMRARSQATTLSHCVYIYRCRSNWVMTTDLSELPMDAAVWMVPAGRDDSGRKNLHGC
jgi:hypothetical protein